MKITTPIFTFLIALPVLAISGPTETDVSAKVTDQPSTEMSQAFGGVLKLGDTEGSVLVSFKARDPQSTAVLGQ